VRTRNLLTDSSTMLNNYGYEIINMQYALTDESVYNNSTVSDTSNGEKFRGNFTERSWKFHRDDDRKTDLFLDYISAGAIVAIAIGILF
jgi:hypothetical protein